MVRTSQFDTGAFVDAAISLVAEGGPSAATMAAIARKVGAPTGSIYHRFASRAAVLAAAWAAVHGAFVAQVSEPLGAGQGLDAALAVLDWARRDAVRARFLLLNEADALFEDGPPPAQAAEEIRRQEAALDAAFQACVGQACVGQGGAEAQARARFQIFDGPIALIRPHLLAGTPIPDFVEQMVIEIHGGLPPRQRKVG
jgi:AcrR family transcriptional regulator